MQIRAETAQALSHGLNRLFSLPIQRIFIISLMIGRVPQPAFSIKHHQ